MSNKDAFFEHIKAGYSTEGDFISLGAAMLDGETLTDAFVKVPLETINRHGLIAGATGTGKTKTLQVFAENLSEQGIPVLLMDMKGDLSGIAQPSPGHQKIEERHAKIGIPFTAKKISSGNTLNFRTAGGSHAGNSERIRSCFTVTHYESF
jgi:hypothetical protein